MLGRQEGLQQRLKALQREAGGGGVDDGRCVAVLPAGQLVGAGAGEGREPGPHRQAAGGGADHLLGDTVEGVRVLAQDRGGGGGCPGGHLLDDGDGVPAQLGPGPGAALALYAVGGRRGGGDDAEGPAGQRVRGSAGQGGGVAGDLVVERVVDDSVGGAGAVGLAEGVAVAHGKSMTAYALRSKPGTWEKPGNVVWRQPQVLSISMAYSPLRGE
nr:MAG TPA: hypothetical protein [Caudoviricetes sp.]